MLICKMNMQNIICNNPAATLYSVLGSSAEKGELSPALMDLSSGCREVGDQHHTHSDTWCDGDNARCHGSQGGWHGYFSEAWSLEIG